MSHSRFVATLAALGLVAAFASAGCSSAEEPEASSESALGSAGCDDHGQLTLTKPVYHYTWTKIADDQTYTADDIRRGVGDVVLGSGSCASTVAFVALATAESVSVALEPAVPFAAYGAATSAVGCAAFIATGIDHFLKRFGFAGYWTTSTSYAATSPQERDGECAVRCGSHLSAIDSAQHCWCADGQDPTACSHGPTYTPTPPATQHPQAPGATQTPPANRFPNGSCYNNGNGQEVGTGSCSPGASQGVENGLVYKCHSTPGVLRSQSWRQCPGAQRGTCPAGC